MNEKNIAVWFVVIIIILGGAYFVFKDSFSVATPGNQVATTTPSSATQVQAQDVSVGSGAEAVPNSIVSVLYVGKLQDGTVFDSSEMHKDPKTGAVQPLVFQLGSQGLIPGFQIGVNGMKVGGERVMAVPPTLGYGDKDVKDASGKVIIPANSTIVFDVKLVDVKAPSPAPATDTKATAPSAPVKK